MLKVDILFRLFLLGSCMKTNEIDQKSDQSSRNYSSSFLNNIDIIQKRIKERIEKICEIQKNQVSAPRNSTLSQDFDLLSLQHPMKISKTNIKENDTNNYREKVSPTKGYRSNSFDREDKSPAASPVKKSNLKRSSSFNYNNKAVGFSRKTPLKVSFNENIDRSYKKSHKIKKKKDDSSNSESDASSNSDSENEAEYSQRKEKQLLAQKVSNNIEFQPQNSMQKYRSNKEFPAPTDRYNSQNSAENNNLWGFDLPELSSKFEDSPILLKKSYSEKQIFPISIPIHFEVDGKKVTKVDEPTNPQTPRSFIRKRENRFNENLYKFTGASNYQSLDHQKDKSLPQTYSQTNNEFYDSNYSENSAEQKKTELKKYISIPIHQVNTGLFERILARKKKRKVEPENPDSPKKEGILKWTKSKLNNLLSFGRSKPASLLPLVNIHPEQNNTKIKTSHGKKRKKQRRKNKKVKIASQVNSDNQKSKINIKQTLIEDKKHESQKEKSGLFGWISRMNPFASNVENIKPSSEHKAQNKGSDVQSVLPPSDQPPIQGDVNVETNQTWGAWLSSWNPLNFFKNKEPSPSTPPLIDQPYIQVNIKKSPEIIAKSSINSQPDSPPQPKGWFELGKSYMPFIGSKDDHSNTNQPQAAKTDPKKKSGFFSKIKSGFSNYSSSFAWLKPSNIFAKTYYWIQNFIANFFTFDGNQIINFFTGIQTLGDENKYQDYLKHKRLVDNGEITNKDEIKKYRDEVRKQLQYSAHQARNLYDNLHRKPLDFPALCKK